ncbi:MAG: glycosyltransferase 61 family protein [Limnothrix sp. BL-A-16]
MAASDLTPDLQRLLDRAAACREQGHWPEAIVLDRQAIQLAPDSALAYGSLGQSLRGADRPSAAAQAWKRAIAQGLAQPSQMAIAHWELGKLQWELGEHNGAIEQFLNAIALNPTLISLQTLDDLSRWLRRRDRPTAAAAFEQAALKRLIPEVRQLIHQGNATLAARWCLWSLQIAPAHNAAYNLLFEALTALDRPEEAKDCFCRLVPATVLDEFAPHPPLPIARLPLTANDSAGLKPLAIWPLVAPYPLPEPQSILCDRPTANFPAISPLQEPPRQCWALNNGRVWVDACNRVFWNRDGAVVDDLSIGVEHLIATSHRLPAPQPIQGTVAVIAKQHTENYFHWVTEFLPQAIDLLDLAQSVGKSIDYWYFDADYLPFQIQSLESLGISRSQILASQDIPHLQADLLLTFNASSLIEGRRESLQKLRQIFLAKTSPNRLQSRRLYLGRSHARRILNENQLRSVLQKWGFEPVPEGLSFAEQIQLFAEASVIIGPHGAAFTNMIFSQPQSRILEFFAPSYISHFYWRLSGQLDFQYSYLVGDVVPLDDQSPLSKISFYHDLEISPFVLEQALQNLINSN